MTEYAIHGGSQDNRIHLTEARKPAAAAVADIAEAIARVESDILRAVIEMQPSPPVGSRKAMRSDVWQAAQKLAALRADATTAQAALNEIDSLTGKFDAAFQ